MMTGPLVKLTKKDFTSDQEVRWCPGCGDYSILAALQMLMPDLGVRRVRQRRGRVARVLAGRRAEQQVADARGDGRGDARDPAGYGFANIQRAVGTDGAAQATIKARG